MILKTDLYQHQRAAVDKLLPLKVGALYMEQGTGKTRTALEMINERYNAGKLQAVIWLCPCSVKENLRRDIINHAGEVPNYITISGIETMSTSYKTLWKLHAISEKYQTMLIVDESNLVKNIRAKRTEHIIDLAKYCKYRMILNGTPITRTEADLFSQWYILDYRILGYLSFYSFAANHLEYDEYGKIRRALNTDYLANKIAPYTYQVKKDDCLGLPDKLYHSVYYEMPEEQALEYYRVREEFLDLVREEDEATIYRLFTALQLVISGEKITSRACEHITHDRMFKAEDNPRIKMLQYAITDDKTIIYCKYHKEIEDICEVLGADAVPYEGCMTLKQRTAAIDSFRNKKKYLVANKSCAGYGLNLQFCSNVIYYSNDFNLATRLQSEDRVHRIGQTEKVVYTDICSSGGIDEMISSSLQRKEDLMEKFKEEIRRFMHDKNRTVKSTKARLDKKRKLKKYENESLLLEVQDKD